jgi:glycosyltransferase involved in cell wall biosynthesis
LDAQEGVSGAKVLYLGNKLQGHGCTPTGVEYLSDLLEKEGYQVEAASDLRFAPFRLIHMVLAVLRNRNSDIVLIDTYSSLAFYFALINGVLLSWLSVPFVLVLRGGNLPARANESRRLLSLLAGRAAQSVSVSIYLQEKLLPYVQSTYIPNPIEISRYRFKERPSPRPRLLWVRSLHRVYDPAIAIRIISRLSREMPDASLTLVGPDKDGSRAILQEMARVGGVASRVKFTGKLSKEEWIGLSQTCDIFINTTTVDNMPVSVVEAMALGLPVVSTNVGGMPYLIENEVDGLLVAQGDCDAFCAAIKRIVSEPGLSLRLTQNARKKVESFDSALVLQQWRKLINGIVQSRS